MIIFERRKLVAKSRFKNSSATYINGISRYSLDRATVYRIVEHAIPRQRIVGSYTAVAGSYIHRVLSVTSTQLIQLPMVICRNIIGKSLVFELFSLLVSRTV